MKYKCRACDFVCEEGYVLHRKAYSFKDKDGNGEASVKEILKCPRCTFGDVVPYISKYNREKLLHNENN